jgi:predicted AAA+ superfamily ATPase
MIERVLAEKVKSMRGKFPVLSLTGPRQSGKTTLLRAIYPDLPYVSLEDLDNRELAIRDPRGFLANYTDGAVIDEAQYVPALFSYIQGIVDHSDAHFALSGSQNFLLLEKISQSLAGRAAILKLLPLTQSELSKSGKIFSTFEEAVWFGSYPRIIDKDINPTDFYPAYINTFIERDVRQMQNIGNLRAFSNFIRLCAGRIGQPVNMQSLATDAGISPNTAKAWLSILEAAYIIHFLQPHHRNFNKRITKTPKLYFIDTGLACSLLKLESADQLKTYYNKGNLFENYVVMEFLKNRFNQGKNANLFFWQSKEGKEIDLILDTQPEPVLIEMKSSLTRQPHLLDNLKYWRKLSDQDKNLYVVYGGSETVKTSDGIFVGWDKLDDIFNLL